MSEAIFGLIGVIVGSLITGMKELWMGWHSRRKNQQYLAIRVVTYLDFFSERCAEVVDDDGDIDQEGYTRTSIAEPEFDIDSIEVEWKSISAELMYRILNFSNLFTAAKSQIKAAGEYSDPPDHGRFFDERQIQYANLGLEAIDIANVLRQNHNFPDRDYEHWAPEAFMKEKRSKILTSREERSEATKAMFASLKTEHSKSDSSKNHK